MDNITPPADPNAPQGGQPPQGAGNMPDPNNPNAGQADPAQAPGGADSGSLQMPPDLGNQAGQDPNAMPPASPDPNAAPPQDQGEVEDVLAGAENNPPQTPMEGQPEAGGLPNIGTPDQGGQMPQDAGQSPTDPGMMPPQDMGGQVDQSVTPQGQPDFSGSAGDGGAMPPADPNAMPPQPPQPNMQPPKQGSKFLPVLLIILIIVVLGGVSIAYFMNIISLPFLDNLLGRNQETTTDQTTDQTADQTVNQFPEDQQRKNDLAQIKSALEEYFTETQAYPISKTASKISESTSVAYKALVPKYLEEMPTDPASPTKYYGYKSADGTSFELTAVLDNTSDSEGTPRGSYTFYILTNNSATTTEDQTTTDTTNQ